MNNSETGDEVWKINLISGVEFDWLHPSVCCLVGLLLIIFLTNKVCEEVEVGRL